MLEEEVEVDHHGGFEEKVMVIGVVIVLKKVTIVMVIERMKQ